MNATQEKAATGWHREAAQERSQHGHDSKIARVLAELRIRSLNRFEAERIGDHALNSTIATLRAEGFRIIDEWERVPTRFGKPARVKRYSYAGGARHV